MLLQWRHLSIEILGNRWELLLNRAQILIHAGMLKITHAESPGSSQKIAQCRFLISRQTPECSDVDE